MMNGKIISLVMAVIMVGSLFGSVGISAKDVHSSEAGGQVKDGPSASGPIRSSVGSTMMWRYDAQRTGDFSPVAGNIPPNDQLKWRSNTPGGNSPVVANGMVYMGSGNQVYALDAATGATVWNYTIGGQVSHSSPAVANGIVYVGADNDGNLTALDAATGARIWRYKTPYWTACDPAIVNGVVYIGPDALDAATGARMWHVSTRIPGNLMWHISVPSSHPAVANGIVYAGDGNQGHFFAFDAATGARIWTATWAQDNCPHTTPVVANGIVYFGDGNGYVRALDAATGATLWKDKIGHSVDVDLAAANGIVYVINDERFLYALDAATGATLWNYKGVSDPPVVANGIVYVVSGGILYALDAATGATVRRYQSESYEAYSSPTIVNGVIYVSGDRVYAIGSGGVVNQPLTASFTYAGDHDGTTSNQDIYGVTTKMVDEQPLVGGKIKFDASASTPKGKITQYTWDLGDGKPITSQDPTKVLILTEAKKYTVTLTVTDGVNSASISKEVDLSLLPGDLIFIRTPGWTELFDLIHERYTHVGMYVGKVNGQDMMIEASQDPDHGSPDKGVHLSPLAGWGYPTEPLATAYRVKNADEVIRQKAINFAWSKLGWAYNVAGVTFDTKSVDNPKGIGYYCSELVWAAYYSATGGVIDLGRTPKGVHPDDIVKESETAGFVNGNTKFIGGHWENYPVS